MSMASGLPVNGVLKECPPHVVILGAGASLACLPEGDRNGRRLPLMANFVETVGVEGTLRRHGIDAGGRNFEDVYSDLHESDHAALPELEAAVRDYFSGLRLPDVPTLYDQLVVSLRSKDLIATFNWDPLLLEAYCRAPFPIDAKPKLAFLHGCVGVGVCFECSAAGLLANETCPRCGVPFQSSRLLYPIRTKNYQEDPFIADQWQYTTGMLRHAYMVTLMGYGAPASDVAAVELMHGAASEAPHEMREQRQFEIVDIAEPDVLEAKWSRFFTRSHFGLLDDLAHSRIIRFPRRSCEGLMAALLFLSPWPEDTVPPAATLQELYDRVAPLVERDSE